MTEVRALYVVVPTLCRLISSDPPPPETVIDVISVHATGPVSGRLRFTFTLPSFPQRIEISSDSSSPVTVRTPADMLEVTTASDGVGIIRNARRSRPAKTIGAVARRRIDPSAGPGGIEKSGKSPGCG
jgi:hypothetical protein